MKIKLSGLDRMNIFDMLPKNSGRLEMIAVTEITDTLKLTAEEVVEFGLKDGANGGIVYNINDPKLNVDKDFELKKPHTDLLKKLVEEMDAKELWTPNNIKTCLKIENIR